MNRDGRGRRSTYAKTAATLCALAALFSCGHDRGRGPGDSTDVAPPRLSRGARPAPGVDTAGERARLAALAAFGDSTPKYGAGDYQLIRVRGRPLVDDSTEARRQIESNWKWAPLDTAETAEDTTALLQYYINRDRTGDWLNLYTHAANEEDSAEVLANYLEAASCTEWLVSGTVHLSIDGKFVETHVVKQYCHGTPPRYTAFNAETKDSLQFCAKVGQPVKSTIHHVTCVTGTYQNRWRNFRHVGDTLQLGQPCHGRSTYLLRGVSPPLAPATSGRLINYNGTC